MNTLYKDLKAFFRKYLHANEEEIGLLVQWAVATHQYGKYPAFPILHIQGDFATGKNRRLELISMICYKPDVSTNPSASALFRTIDAYKGTVLIDEADFVLGSNDVKSCLLAGFKKGGCFRRSVQRNNHAKGFEPVKFDVYCPKVLVTRNGIKDDALLSRSITITTLPKPSDSNVPDILPLEAYNEGKLLKNRLIKALNNQTQRRIP